MEDASACSVAYDPVSLSLEMLLLALMLYLGAHQAVLYYKFNVLNSSMTRPKLDELDATPFGYEIYAKENILKPFLQKIGVSQGLLLFVTVVLTIGFFIHPIYVAPILFIEEIFFSLTTWVLLRATWNKRWEGASCLYPGFAMIAMAGLLLLWNKILFSIRFEFYDEKTKSIIISFITLLCLALFVWFTIWQMLLVGKVKKMAPVESV